MTTYYIDLFTWQTWQEFLKAGGNVSGFREKRWTSVKKIKPGDRFICYLTGISRFIGVLEVTGQPYKDDTPIWDLDVFPSRVPVQVELSLPPEHGIPVTSLKSELSYFQNMKSSNAWSGHFRGSPTKEKPKDAAVIIEALQEALENPVHRDYDPRKLERTSRIFTTKSGAVTIPENDETSEPETPITHEEIQWLILSLGSQMGLDLWVAKNDRNKSYAGNYFSNIAGLRDTLPTQFDAATNRTIELIDVLWLKGNAIVAAFEIEHTTAIYSGLLRMSDLISMQPNINIQLYIVAPDERRDKVFSEINRPTFSKLEPSLPEICQYIPYSSLKIKLDQVQEFLQYLDPGFLDEIAETFEDVGI